MSISLEQRRCHSRADVAAYVDEMVVTVGGWRSWGAAGRPGISGGRRPTAANERHEERAWRQLRLVLVALDLEDTWLDPASLSFRGSVH